MHVIKINKPLFKLPKSHPAIQFLEAFIDCRQNCIGKEIQDDTLDYKWYSQSENREILYSSFAYQYLAFDIILDGWLTNAPTITPDEQHWLNQLPHWRELMNECKIAAIKENKIKFLEMQSQVINLFDLWEKCIRYRIDKT
jgi:hypothetical protein